MYTLFMRIHHEFYQDPVFGLMSLAEDSTKGLYREKNYAGSTQYVNYQCLFGFTLARVCFISCGSFT